MWWKEKGGTRNCVVTDVGGKRPKQIMDLLAKIRLYEPVLAELCVNTQHVSKYSREQKDNVDIADRQILRF